MRLRSLLPSFLLVAIVARAAIAQSDLSPILSLEAVRQASRPTGQEEALLSDAADGRLDSHDLLTAAMIAAGDHNSTALERRRQVASRHFAQAERMAARSESALGLARALFDYVHRSILTGGYQADATDVGRAIEGGPYNCVSATILYVALAEKAGLRAFGVETPGHVQVRVAIGSTALDLEMTDPQWFLRSTARRTSSEQERLLDPIQLTALAYYNRGVSLIAQKRFAEAAAANGTALRFDPTSGTARANLLAAINNWALDLCERGEYAEAAALLSRGREAAPDYVNFSVNDRYVRRQWSNRTSSVAAPTAGVGSNPIGRSPRRDVEL